VIDKVLETNKEIDKGTQEKKDKIDNAKDVKDIQDQWNQGLKHDPLDYDRKPGWKTKDYY